MKKNLLFVPFLIAILLASSCKDRCVAVQTGSINLQESSKKFTPYQEGAKSVFQNAQGEKMTFTVSLVEENYPLCVKVLCDPVDPYKPSTCEFYEAQGIRNILRADNDTLLVELVVSTQNYEAESTLFYDFFSIQMSAIGLLARGELVTHVHFSQPAFDPTKSLLKDEMEFASSLSVLGKSYEDVYFTSAGDHQLYLQENIGLILLKMNGEYWELME